MMPVGRLSKSSSNRKYIYLNKGASYMVIYNYGFPISYGDEGPKLKYEIVFFSTKI